MRFHPIVAGPLVFFEVVGLSLLIAQTPRERLDQIFAMYRSPDPEVRSRAGAEGPAFVEQWFQQDVESMRSVIPVLLEALDDKNPTMRLQGSALFRVVAMLRKADAPKFFQGVIPELVNGVDDPDARVRANIIGTLALLEPSPPPEAIEPFFRHLDDPDEEARRMAVLGLLRASPQSQRAAEAVAAMLDKRQDSEQRRGILQTLVFVKPTHPMLVAKVAEQLEEPNTMLQQDALRVLSAIGPPAAIAIHKIREIANDPATDRELRLTAEAALRAIEQRPPPRTK